MDVLSLILGILIMVTIFKIVPTLYEMYVYRKTMNKIPGISKELPLIGVMYLLLTIERQERLWYFLAESFRIKNGLFRYFVLHRGFVSLTSPKHLEAILPSTENIQKGDIYDQLKNWLGQGLLTSTGKQWFHDRKFLTPTFHFNILAEFVPTIWEKAEILINCIDKELKNKPGKAINIFDFTIKAALDVLCETALGVNLHVQDRTDVEYVKALHRFSHLTVYRSFSPWFQANWIFYMTPSGKEYKESIEIMHRVTNEIIKKRKEERKERKIKSEDEAVADNDIGGKKKKAMLDLLLDTSEMSEQPLTDDQIREQVDTFLFAGHDTTAAAISWAIFCLGNNPDCQEQVHEELESVFGDSKEPPTLKQLSELKYLERVMKEALRLFPSVPLFTRLLTKEIVVDGYTVPKNTNVVITPLATHRHPEVWENPTKFDPDRFLPENSKGRHPYAYIPFSAGPRNCIGQKFAQMEEKMMLTAILRKWRVKSVLKLDEIQIYASFILRPHTTVDIYFTEK